ncbi:MAG: nucleotide-binding universal stress UspA family protein [Polyangiales bacterium]|jgi:nucleotide-binding universal stress UspA family protein
MVPPMLNLDEFESAFRSASKKPFTYSPPNPKHVLVITDIGGAELEAYMAAVKELLAPMSARCSDLRWTVKDSFDGVEGVLRLVEEAQPDLIVTYRNMKSDAWAYSYSLGVYLNALTRGTGHPVLITPSPRAFPSMKWKHSLTDQVMAIDDSLTGDDSLINWAALMMREKGQLHLTHMENADVYERYIDAISKIPRMDTNTAKETLLAQLLKEPRDYIESVRRALEAAGAGYSVVAHVDSGHRVADYRTVIDAEAIDLVAFPTLEQDRIALHGAAYSLAVELVETPVLMV